MKTKKEVHKPYIPSQRDAGAFAYFLVLNGKISNKTEFTDLQDYLRPNTNDIDFAVMAASYIGDERLVNTLMEQGAATEWKLFGERCKTSSIKPMVYPSEDKKYPIVDIDRFANI